MVEKVASTVTDMAFVTALNSSPPPLSPQSDRSNKHQEQFAASFASLYNSIFSPESQFPISLSFSPSPPSSSSPPNRFEAITTTEHRLRQARLILEYGELNEHYNLCLRRLQSLMTEIDSLRHENETLRIENSDLLNLIEISTSSSSSVSSPIIHNRQQISNFVGHDVASKHFRRDTNSYPKSIAFRSPEYLNINQRNQLGYDSVLRKGEKEDEIYRQGMMKTEICNKWQETGSCPYGEYCQFAHGIDELRPVIRHPRYKTQVCRMILTGATCHYGHRCHFRHSLTDQEKILLSS